MTQVEQRRHEQRRRAEQEREPPPARVRDDAGRDLEQHLADGEERVRGERLGVSRPASSRNSVLMPQMNDAASVVSRVSSR